MKATIRNRSLSILLAVCMILSLPGTILTVHADSSVRLSPLNLTETLFNSAKGWVASGTSDIYNYVSAESAAQGWLWQYDLSSRKYTLTLSGVHIDCSSTGSRSGKAVDFAALSLPAGSTLRIADGTVNTIIGGLGTFTSDSATDLRSYAIYSPGDLNILGSGTLSAESIKAFGEWVPLFDELHSYAVFLSGETLRIGDAANHPTVSLKSGDAAESWPSDRSYSSALYGSLQLENGDVSLTSGYVTGPYALSAGVRFGLIDISGGSLTIRAGKIKASDPESRSFGGTLHSFTGGTLYATGYSSAISLTDISDNSTRSVASSASLMGSSAYDSTPVDSIHAAYSSEDSSNLFYMESEVQPTETKALTVGLSMSPSIKLMPAEDGNNTSEVYGSDDPKSFTVTLQNFTGSLTDAVPQWCTETGEASASGAGSNLEYHEDSHTVTFTPTASVGIYHLKLTGRDGSGPDILSSNVVSFTITKAVYPLAVEKTVSIPTLKTVDGSLSLADIFSSDDLPEGASAVSAERTASQNVMSSVSVSADGSGLQYTSNSNPSGSALSDSYSVKIQSADYEDFAASVIFTTHDQLPVTFDFNPEDAVYDGKPHTGYTGSVRVLTADEKTDVTAACSPLVIRFTGISGKEVYPLTDQAPADAGYYFVTFYFENNTYIGNETDIFTIQKADQAAPAAPALLSSSRDSISVSTLSGQKYMCQGPDGNTDWQDSGSFTQLSTDTEYKIYTYLTGDENHNDSLLSEPLTVRTSKEEIVSLTPPEDRTLKDFCETAEDVIGLLEASIDGKDEDGDTQRLTLQWSVSGSYDSSDGKTNSFLWSASAPAGYTFSSGLAASGSILVTNKPAVPVIAPSIKLSPASNIDGTEEVYGDHDTKTFTVTLQDFRDSLTGALPQWCTETGEADTKAAGSDLEYHDDSHTVTFTSTAPAGTYHFRLTGHDGTGAETISSNIITFTIRKAKYPLALSKTVVIPADSVTSGTLALSELFDGTEVPDGASFSDAALTSSGQVMDSVSPDSSDRTLLNYTSKSSSSSEVRTDTFSVKITASNYEDFNVTVLFTNYGKKTPVTFRYENEDAVYDGNPHPGYTGSISVITAEDGKDVTSQCSPLTMQYDGVHGQDTYQSGQAPTGSGFYFLTVKFENDQYAGCETSVFEIRKAGQNAPSAPTLLSSSYDSLAVRADRGQQYRCQGPYEYAKWQDGGTFTGLSTYTEYKIYTFIPGDVNHEDSPVSQPLTVKTAKEKIVSLTPPADRSLSELCRTAGDVIRTLDETLCGTDQNGDTQLLPVQWEVVGSYDSTDGKSNQFRWTASAPDGYEFDSTLASAGTITVTNRASAPFTVPASSSIGSTQFDAVQSGHVTTVSPSAGQTAAIVSSEKDTGNVKIDFTSAQTETAVISSSLISSVKNSRNPLGLTLVLSDGTVTIDEPAVDFLADGNDLKVCFAEISAAALSAVQQKSYAQASGAISVVSTRKLIRFSMSSGDTAISTCGNGTVSVSTPYTLSAGADGSKITAWYLDDSGKMGKLNGSYSAGTKRAGFTSSSVRTFVIGSLAEERLYGPDRYGTMTENVRKGFPDGCDTVVLASGENWPDALAASALAGMYECPVLLTEPNRLTAQTASLLSFIKASKVYMIGGTSALSDNVRTDLIRCGIDEKNIQRVYGADRTKTAEEIEKKIVASVDSDICIIASGKDFADALSISSYAYSQKAPILLTQQDGTLSADTLKLARNFESVCIIGGNAAVSEKAEEQLSGASICRISGADRYATSKAVINAFCPDTVPLFTVSSGENYPDALTSAPLSGMTGGSTLLVKGNGSVLNDDQSSLIGSADSVCVIGGTAAVTGSLEDAVISSMK